MQARFVLALVAALVGLATACASTPPCPAAPTAARGPAFLWRVQKAGDANGSVVWLYGTIHAAGLDAVPRDALDAFAASKRLVTELGAEKPDPDLFRSYARIASGPGIDHQLAPDDWYDLRDTLRGTIEEDHLRRAAPWYAMSLLTSYSAPSHGPSMDAELVERGDARELPIDALETWEDQLKLLATAVVLDDLAEAIRARKTMRCDLARMRQAYEAGDTETMTALLVVPRSAETMLYARNRAWLPKLETYFDNGGAFVAVGLGHLLGDQGLPALLAKAGYTVERVATR